MIRLAMARGLRCRLPPFLAYSASCTRLPAACYFGSSTSARAGDGDRGAAANRGSGWEQADQPNPSEPGAGPRSRVGLNRAPLAAPPGSCGCAGADRIETRGMEWQWGVRDPCYTRREPLSWHLQCLGPGCSRGSCPRCARLGAAGKCARSRARATNSRRAVSLSGGSGCGCAVGREARQTGGCAGACVARLHAHYGCLVLCCASAEECHRGRALQKGKGCLEHQRIPH